MKPLYLCRYCLLTALACLNAGCLFLPMQIGGPRNPQFSHDNSLAAWISVDELFYPLYYERRQLQTAYVEWRSMNGATPAQSIRLISVGADYGGYGLEDFMHLSFSPDSRHLAVAGPYFLRVVDTPTGRCRDLLPRSEIVSSLAWLNDEEIAYAAHTSLRGEYGSASDRTFWRQRIDGKPESRVLLHHEEGIDAGLHSGVPYFSWPLEHWSPRGSYVLYACRSSNSGGLQLLDVRYPRVRTIDSSWEYLSSENVAWKDDESAVAIIGGNLAMLIDPRTLRTTDFTAPFVQSIAKPTPFQEPSWTPDGRYLLYNDLYEGGFLIQPAPYRCIPSAELLGGKAYVYPLPVNGWVRVRDRNHMGCFLDYERRTLVPVGWVLGTWSDDGTIIAHVDGNRHVRSQHFCLPSPCTRPASASSSTTTLPITPPG